MLANQRSILLFGLSAAIGSTAFLSRAAEPQGLARAQSLDTHQIGVHFEAYLENISRFLPEYIGGHYLDNDKYGPIDSEQVVTAVTDRLKAASDPNEIAAGLLTMRYLSEGAPLNGKNERFLSEISRGDDDYRGTRIAAELTFWQQALRSDPAAREHFRKALPALVQLASRETKADIDDLNSHLETIFDGASARSGAADEPSVLAEAHEKKIEGAMLKPYVGRSAVDGLIYKEVPALGEMPRRGDGDSLIGFEPHDQGLRAVLSPSAEMRSIRNLPFLLDDYWEDERQARIVPLSIQESPAPLRGSLKTTQDWQQLPGDVRRLFESGRYLVTEKEGHPPEPFDGHRYSLLMYVTPNAGFARGGRSGLLLRDGHPVTVAVAGKEFLVELKGSGSSFGGYMTDDYQGISGGIPISYARREIEMLERRRGTGRYNEGRTLRGLGSMEIAPGQGYILRLSPSSFRLSYARNPSLPKFDSIERTREAAAETARVLALGLVPRTHVENFVVLGPGEGLAMTDSSDIFHISEFPRQVERQYLEPKRAVTGALAAIGELRGYSQHEEQAFAAVREGVVQGLKDQIHVDTQTEREILASKDFNDLAQVLWDRVLKAQYEAARKSK